MTAYLDMRAGAEALRALYVQPVERFLEEERELRRRLEPIGPLPAWWRPVARRHWRDAARKIHYEWSTWCLFRAMETMR